MKYSSIIWDAIKIGMTMQQKQNMIQLQDIILQNTLAVNNPDKLDTVLDKFVIIIAHMRDINNEWRKEQEENE